jgi:hypothetical protein
MGKADGVLWGPPICKGYAHVKARETVNRINGYLIIYAPFSVFFVIFETVKILLFSTVP